MSKNRSKRKPIVSLVGRPNVGKSSIFNRLMRKADSAIAYNTPGVTRDRNYALATLNDLEMVLVDTGGFYPDANNRPFVPDNPRNKEFLRQQHVVPRHEDFLGLMTEQAFLAIEESDLVCLVVDVREGLSPFDEQLAQRIRQKGKPFWVLANKFDTKKQEGQELPFYALNIPSENLFPLSAAHGEGFLDLEESFELYLQQYYGMSSENENGEAPASLCNVSQGNNVWAKLAIIGAPNSGKSTLLNRLLKQERALVSSLPGTTMDPVTGFFDLYMGEEGEALKTAAAIKTIASNVEVEEEIEGEIEEEGFEEEFEENVEAEFEDVDDIDEFEETEEVDEDESEADAEEEQTLHPPEETFDRWVTLEVIDTAGIRRKSSIKGDLETQSVFRSLRVLTEADIVLLVVDALIGISHHDRRLCEIALEKGKSLIIVLNKVDLLKDLQRKPKDWRGWLEAVQERIPWSYCQIVPISAKTGQMMGGLKRSLKKTILSRYSKINTAQLNQTLEQLLIRKPLSLRTKYGGKVLKMRYATVVKMNPPTVLVFSNLTKEITPTYRRYLTNGLRAVLGLKNTPIHLVFRKE